MVFSDLFFLFVFLAACILCYFVARGIKAKNIVLVFFSLFFYAWGEPTYVLILSLSTVVNYFAGLAIDKYRGRILSKVSIVSAIVFNIGLLFVFKYTNFFIENINALFGSNIPLTSITLPIGISFFTFQILSYIIDCYWEKVDVQRNYLNLLLYISLFPQLVAGPIVRYETIEEEINNRKSTIKDVSEGSTRFILGLSKKVLIANSLFSVVTNLLGDYGKLEHLPCDVLPTQSFVGTIVGVVCYALYVYFDFSGYSDMAIGLGRIFGFHFDENFKHPFVSRNISEFWQRWHISLGSFFRDYLLYVPIFGKRRKYLSLFLVWFCTGFWHGASWNFIIWGLYFGSFILIEMLVGKKRMKKIPKALSHVYSLIVVAVGFAIFYFEDLGDLAVFFKNIVFANGNSFVDPISKSTILNYLYLIVISAIISFPILPRIKNWFYANKNREAVAVCLTSVSNVVLLLLCIVMLTDSSNNPFLYFRF